MKKKTILKRVLAFGLAASMAIGMVGCKKEETESNENNEKVGVEILDGKTISFLTCQGKFKQEYYAMADAMKEKYGCTVEFQIVPDAQFFQMVKVKLGTGEVPDVFEYNLPLQNKELGVAQNCEDLSSEPWVKRLVNPDVAKDPDDGKFYALPQSSAGTTLAVYYNKDVLAKCGIEDPKPQSFEEFEEILKTVKEKSEGVTPLYMTNGDAWTTQVFMSAQFPIALGDDIEKVFDDLQNNRVQWQDVDVFVDVLTKFRSLIDNGYVNEDHLSAKYTSVAEKFGNGEIAMYYINSPCAQDVASKYPDVNIGSFPIPMNGNDKLTMVHLVQGLFVPKAGKEVDVAKQFLNVWSSPEIQNIYYETLPGFPAMNDVDGGKVLGVLQKQSENYINQGKTVGQVNDYMAVMSPIQQELFAFYVEVASGAKTPEEALASFQKVYADFMAQQGIEAFQ